MLLINRLVIVGVLSFGISTATVAQAGIKLFTGSWIAKAFANDITGGTGPFAYYNAIGLPNGQQCNANQPRCPFTSTPTDGAGGFAPLGGSPAYGLFCAPWTNWQSMGTTARPAKGGTALNTKGQPIPPLYRNPAFFSASGQANSTTCNATSTGYTPGGKGKVQAGHPLTGTWSAVTTGAPKGGFSFRAAGAGGPGGIRATSVVGSIANVYPYIYSYTYANLRNGAGVFGPGSGPGDFQVIYQQGALTVASIRVKQGPARFGGTMQLLGALTTKICFFRNGGCLRGENNWRLDAPGASAYTSGGVVTGGYIATNQAVYYHTALMQSSVVNVSVGGFPWTTGSVTVNATVRGAKTIAYAHGYDNRTSVGGKGTIQLVTPSISRFSGTGYTIDYGSIGIMKIKFVPEPHRWVMLVAGVSLLAVGYRMRGR